MRRTSEQLDEDRALRDSARRFLEDTCAWSSAAQPTDRLASMRQDIADLGWYAIGLPERSGGLGAGASEALLLVEEAGRVLLPIPLAADLLLAPRLMSRSEAQFGNLAKRLASGRARFALVGEDPRSGGLTFERTANGGRLTGRSGVSLGADGATHWLILAGSRSANGAAVLCVEAGVAEMSRMRLFDGRRAANITFNGDEIAAATVIATGHDALELIQEMNDCAAAAAVADAYGALAAGIDLTIGYLNQRRQFGQTLGSFQAVQHLVADAFCDLEGLRSLMIWTAAAIDWVPQERHRAATAAKIALGREGLATAARLIQVSGGIAMTEDYRLGHVYKRLQVSAGLNGSTEAHTRELAAETLPYTGRSSDEARAA